MKAIFFSIVFLSALYSLATPPAIEGKAMFMARCASCHNIHKNLTGPALAGVTQRHSFDWIVRFVQSPQVIIHSGDKEAVALYEKFNKLIMPDHTDLSADAIKGIMNYISEEEKKGEEKAPFAKPTKLHPAYKPLSLHNWGFFTTYLATVVLLIGALVFAVQLKEYERKGRKEL
jgi:cytochrome c551/c552